ncbi:MAG TPA: hypothetical protein VIY48_15190 [Candidatus Paceibacterota bacterium]
MFVPKVAEQIDEDTENEPDVDMLMVIRGHLVFAWSSADEVIHVLNLETGNQLPRVVMAEDRWERDTLEAFADHYCAKHVLVAS